MKNIRYRVKLHNDFTEPYWKSDGVEHSPVVQHKSIDEYVAYDEAVFRSVLDDFLDAPDKKLSDKDVQRDFSSSRGTPLSRSRVDAIKAYYNGRLALKKKVHADLAKVDVKKLKAGFPVMLKYCIPREMNYFSCDDNDPYDAMTTLNDAYIEIELSSKN